MRFILFFIIILVACGSQAIAQAPANAGYKIRYEAKHNSVWDATLILNDRYTYFYWSTPKDDELRKDSVISKKLIHHSVFSDRKENIRYNGLNFPKKFRYLISEKIILFDRIFYTEEKWIPATRAHGQRGVHTMETAWKFGLQRFCLFLFIPVTKVFTELSLK